MWRVVFLSSILSLLVVADAGAKVRLAWQSSDINLQAAYALGTDKFVRLRNAGRAWEEAGKLEYARTQFQRYLDKVPSGPDHDEVAQRLTRLEARLAEQKAAPVAPAAVAVAAPQREVTSQPAVEATAPLAQVEATAQPSGKWLAWTLVGGGGALVAGGVASNQTIRRSLVRFCGESGLRLVMPPPALCTDNGAMIAWTGIERLLLGLTDGMDFPARPRWPLDQNAERVHNGKA